MRSSFTIRKQELRDQMIAVLSKIISSMEKETLWGKLVHRKGARKVPIPFQLSTNYMILCLAVERWRMR